MLNEDLLFIALWPQVQLLANSKAACALCLHNSIVYTAAIQRSQIFAIFTRGMKRKSIVSNAVSKWAWYQVTVLKVKQQVHNDRQVLSHLCSKIYCYMDQLRRTCGSECSCYELLSDKNFGIKHFSLYLALVNAPNPYSQVQQHLILPKRDNITMISARAGSWIWCQDHLRQVLWKGIYILQEQPCIIPLLWEPTSTWQLSV